MVTKTQSYLLLDPVRESHGFVTSERLGECTERHHVVLEPDDSDGTGDWTEADLEGASGVVIAVHEGVPFRPHVKLAKSLLSRNTKVWFWWPSENIVEALDAELLSTFQHQILAKKMVKAGLKARNFGRSILRTAYQVGGLGSNRLKERANRMNPAPPPVASNQIQEATEEVERLLEVANPVAAPKDVLRQKGAYLRFDFWSQITSGGSYGHTCYVARALADLAHDFVCLMPSRYSLLDDLGVQQVAIESPYAEWPEDHIVIASGQTYAQIRTAIEAVAPAFIYERLVLGSITGTKISQELQIPYIVEYNGSEISMRRSFEGQSYLHEDFYLKAELAAFQQATLITVISEPVRDDLIARGVDPKKILLNPNGACPRTFDSLAPMREAARKELGFGADDQVIGFTGTFGGWHGVDVLAESLSPILKKNPRARFLLIGDGNYKHLVDDKIKKERLGDRVICTGQIPQTHCSRLLQACDLFVSPHDSHMVDSRFFGSPTKVFDYMACGKAIVASDLEQIGEVLSPALRMNANGFPQDVPNARSILCRPGDLDQFVEAVTFALSNPDVAQQLGQNSKQAITSVYSWDQHVGRVARALNGDDLQALAQEALPRSAGSEGSGAPAATPELELIATEDHYKAQTQEQWNNDPCGSQYVEESEPNTLDWYEEVERYRYDEYAPWMAETMEFAKHPGKKVLEIGGGLGTDLAQFAKGGAEVTDLDLSAGHLGHAKRNFELRGLDCTFVHHDAENLPFPDNSFDVVYSNGVIHHTPNTRQVVNEIYRILRPGGRTILMVYAENSLHYWRNLFVEYGLKRRELDKWSMAEIMSRHVEINENGQKPLVKVYTKKRLRQLMHRFSPIEIVQRQLMPVERPWPLRWMSADKLGRICGWNLIVKATKPHSE